MTKITRRSFISRSALVGAGFALPASTWSQPTGANGDIRVAVIGFNGRGEAHISEFSKMKGARVVALCDCDQAVLDRGRAAFEKKNQKVETCIDIRKLLENKDVDVVSIATPNHWHSLAGIWACQAGKDVYVEKPVSHNPWEGRQLVKASEKYQRVIQMGVQSRSGRGIAEAIAWAKTGALGKLTHVH